MSQSPTERTVIPDFSQRSARPELMDDPVVDREELEGALDGLAMVNSLLGGNRTSIDGVERLVEPGRLALSVLDVGSGGGDFSRRLSHWANRQGIDLYAKGIDLSTQATRYARWRSRAYRDLEFEARDFFDVADDSCFDIVHASLMLHHMSDEEAVQGLRKMYDISRLGVVINDLHRHPIGYLGSLVILRILSRNRLVRHDGPVSVLRGFKKDELQDLVKRAGLPEAEISWRPLFRWQCVIRKEAA